MMSKPNPRSCFVSVPPTFKRAKRWNAVSATRPCRVWLRTRLAPTACLPDNEGSRRASTDEPKSKPLSSSEEMAILMGQDPAVLREKAEKMRREIRKENIQKYSIVLATTVVSVGLFLLQKADPSSGSNLLAFLRETSAPIEVVGSNGKPSMIEFSASWCENCKAMASRVFALENEYSGRVNFVVVDGDDPNRQEIVDKFGVDGIPQFSMVSSDGKVRGNLIGMVPKEALGQDLDALLKGTSLPFPGLSLDELRGGL